MVPILVVVTGGTSRIARLGLAALAVLALVAALPAAAATDPHAEKIRLNRADNALAKRIAVSARDLPPGWVSTVADASGADSNARCSSFDPDLSRFTITGRARSAFKAMSGVAQVLSFVDVFRSRADAIGDLRATTVPAVTACLREMLTRELTSQSSLKMRVVSARKVGAPRVGDASAAYRLTVKVSSPQSSMEVPVYLDVLVFAKSRSMAGLFFVGGLKPVEGRDVLAAKVAARMG